MAAVAPVAAAPAAAAAVKSKPAVDAAAAKWKKPFGTADLVIGVVMGTAFLFLSLVEFSFDHHVFGQIQSELSLGVGTSGKILPASHPLAQALGQFYSWRTTALPLLCYWDLLMACVVPLALLGMIKELVDSARGMRAPTIRHLLDVESLLHLLLVIGITVAQAAPHQARLVAATTAARLPGADPAVASVDVFHDVRALMNAHFLIFGLNALQWFVPFWRARLQSKQDAQIVAEKVAQEKAEKLAEKEAARAAEKARQAATPSQEAMDKRMAEAETVTAAMLAQQAAPQTGAEIRKRK